jgi:hypothetical protein
MTLLVLAFGNSALKIYLMPERTPMMCGMNMDRNMDVQHGHEAWTWTCTMDMDMYHGHGDGQAPWMPECQ